MNYMRQSNALLFDEDLSSESTQGIAFIMHELLHCYI